jgi:hypothetical protein
MSNRPLRRGTRLAAERLSFSFDGRRYQAQLGDTAASALLANGVVLELGRKTWAPQDERAGVESYSSAWGLARALSAWAAADRKSVV